MWRPCRRAREVALLPVAAEMRRSSIPSGPAWKLLLTDRLFPRVQKHVVQETLNVRRLRRPLKVSQQSKAIETPSESSEDCDIENE